MTRAKMQVKVDINFDEINQGEMIILTLQDQLLLKDNEINDDNDILENVEIKEQEKLDFRKKQEDKLKIKNKNFTDKFEDEKGEKALLSHYDEEKMEKQGFFIDDEGNFVEDKQKQLESIAARLKKHKVDFDLFTEDKIASDYQPPEKTTGFKKRKVAKPLDTNDLISFLEQDNEQQQQNKTQAKNQQKPETNGTYQGSIISSYSITLKDLEDEDESLQLQRSMELKMRNQVKQNIEANSLKKFMKQEEKLKELINNNTFVEQESFKKQEEEFAKPKPKSKNVDKNKDKEEIKEISSATDFLKNIKTDVEQYENSLRISAPTPYSIKDTKDGTTSILNISLPTERLVGQTRLQNNLDTQRFNNLETQRFDNSQIQVEEELQEQEEENQEELEKAREELQWMEDEQHGKGLASTLKNLRDRGLLVQQSQDFAGRSKDTRLIDDVNKKEIDLEYRNSSGKLMTQKEAFRYQCWIFHGKGPSKNKIEQRKKKDMVAEKMKSMAPGQTPLMQALKNEQQKTNQSYMVISSKKQFE